MLKWLNRCLTSYRYRVSRKGLPDFEITIYASDDRGAEIQAADIGLKLGLLLLGPV